MQDSGHRGMNDRRGMMDMPLKLTVIMIVIALNIPMIVNVIETNEDRVMDSVLSKEADRIGSAVRAAYYSGDGSSRMIDVDLPEGCEMTLGGSSSDAYAITCTFGGKVVSKTYIEKPSIRFDGPVTISGNVRLEITNFVRDGQSYAGVNVL